MPFRTATPSLAPVPSPLHRRAARSTAARSTALVELMVRYQAGDDDVFPRLYRTLAPAVRGQLVTLLGPDPQLDDFVQETFLKAHTARLRFCPRKVRDDRGVTAWFCSIARNSAINELRRRGVVRAWPLHDEPTCARPHAEHAVLAQEQRHHLHHALRSSLRALSDSQRIVVELHKLHELPLDDVAKQLGLRPGTVRVRAHRGYRALAEHLRALTGDYSLSTMQNALR
ncbi:MAG: RNA polymerase sigma factor [Myxococcota bacterium]